MLVRILGTVYMVVHLERACRRHCQQGAELRAAHTAQVHMGESSEELVLECIGSRPPPAVLVPGIEFGPHHIERGDGHQAVGTDSARIGRSEIGRTYERVDIPGNALPVRTGGGRIHAEHAGRKDSRGQNR